MFDLGRIVMTCGVAALDVEDEIMCCLQRHAAGDWGIVCDEDKQTNDWSVKNNSRIVSAYMVEDTKIFIITECDRSYTTVLLPEEY